MLSFCYAQAAEQKPVTRDIELNWDVQFREISKSSIFYLVILLPQNCPPYQKILSTNFNITPSYITAKNNNRYAVWKFAGSQLKTTRITVYLQAEFSGYDIATATLLKPTRIPPGYLASENNIDSRSPLLIDVVQKYTAGMNDEQAARKLLHLTINRLKYSGYTKDAQGGLLAWNNRKGDCTDFADLYVSLCRAAGIPARHVSGMITDWVYTPGHSWTEIYLKNKGWVPVDPLRCYLGTTTFGKLSPVYLRLSDVRNDSLLANGMLYRWKILNQGKAHVVMTLVNKQ